MLGEQIRLVANFYQVVTFEQRGKLEDVPKRIKKKIKKQKRRKVPREARKAIAIHEWIASCAHAKLCVSTLNARFRNGFFFLFAFFVGVVELVLARLLLIGSRAGGRA